MCEVSQRGRQRRKISVRGRLVQTHHLVPPREQRDRLARPDEELADKPSRDLRIVGCQLVESLLGQLALEALGDPRGDEGRLAVFGDALKVAKDR